MGNKVFCPKKIKPQPRRLNTPEIETESQSVSPVNELDPAPASRNASPPENSLSTSIADEKIKNHLKNVQESLTALNEQNRAAAAATAASAEAEKNKNEGSVGFQARPEVAAEGPPRGYSQQGVFTGPPPANSQFGPGGPQSPNQQFGPASPHQPMSNQQFGPAGPHQPTSNQQFGPAGPHQPTSNQQFGPAGPHQPTSNQQFGPAGPHQPTSNQQFGPAGPHQPTSNQQFGPAGPHQPTSNQQFGPAGPHQSMGNPQFGPGGLQPVFNQPGGQTGSQQMFNQGPTGPPPMYNHQGGPGGPHPNFNHQGGPVGPPPMYQGPMGPPPMGPQSGPMRPQFTGGRGGPNFAPYQGPPLIRSTPNDFQGGPNRNDFQGGPNRNNFQGGPNKNNFQGRRPWQNNQNERGNQRRTSSQQPNQRGRDSSSTDRSSNKSTTQNKAPRNDKVEPGNLKISKQKGPDDKGAIPKVKNQQQFKPNPPQQKQSGSDTSEKQRNNKKLFINNKKRGDAEKISNTLETNEGKLVLDLDDISRLFKQSSLGKGQDDKKGPTLDDLAKMFAPDQDSPKSSPLPEPRLVPKPAQSQKKSRPKKSSPSVSEGSQGDSGEFPEPISFELEYQLMSPLYGLGSKGEGEGVDRKKIGLPEKFAKELKDLESRLSHNNPANEKKLSRKQKKNPTGVKDEDFVKITLDDGRRMLESASESDDDSSVMSHESFTAAVGASNQPQKHPRRKTGGKKLNPAANKQVGNPLKNQPYSRTNPGKNGCLVKLVGNNKKIPSKVEALAMGMEKWQLNRKVEGVVLIAGPIIERPETVGDIIKFGQKHENAQANFLV